MRHRLACAALALASALGCRTPAAAPLADPLDAAPPRFAAIVPDELDHAAADLAVAALGRDAPQTSAALEALEQAEARHREAADAATGLVPAGIEAANAVLFPGRSGLDATRRLLERDDVDAASRERLERWLADDPLALARARVRDARWGAFARFFNAVSEPLGRSLFSPLLPYTLGGALARYAIHFAREEPLPLARRQALAHWERFEREHPGAPEAADLAPQIEGYRKDWHKTRYARALERGEDALDAGRPDAALFYARRALRHRDKGGARELEREAEAALAERSRGRAWSLGFDAAVPAARLAGERQALLVALASPSGGEPDVAAPASAEGARSERKPSGAQRGEAERRSDGSASEDRTGVTEAPLSPERRFARAEALGRAGHDTEMWQEFEVLAADTDSPMARHAAAELLDPLRNPVAAFERARGAERRRKGAWLLLGPLAERPESDALSLADYLLDLPLRVQGVALLPLRLAAWPWRETTPGDAETAVHARRALALPSDAAHGGELRDWLEAFERRRENWVGALRVGEGRADADDAELDALRERAAEQALAVAEAEERSDLRAALLENVARTFPATRAGRQAGSQAREQASESTPHEVRLSAGFLHENPEVAGPAGLDLAPELLDGDPANGELHPDGVWLVGGSELAVHVLAAGGDADDEPERLVAHATPERLARLVARLEETSFRNALLDSDEQIEPDPQRDVFFERARLGLVDVDARPESEARYAYRGLRERYGMVRSRESILPFDIVVQGSLYDLQLGAFPRLRLPRETPDAVLYRE